jgi:hypothetical protein
MVVRIGGRELLDSYSRIPKGCLKNETHLLRWLRNTVTGEMLCVFREPSRELRGARTGSIVPGSLGSLRTLRIEEPREFKVVSNERNAGAPVVCR